MSILFGLLSLVPVLPLFYSRGDSWGSTRRGRGEAKRNTSTTTALERYVYSDRRHKSHRLERGL